MKMECNLCVKSSWQVEICDKDTVWCRHNKKDVLTSTAYICKAFEPEEKVAP